MQSEHIILLRHCSGDRKPEKVNVASDVNMPAVLNSHLSWHH